MPKDHDWRNALIEGLERLRDGDNRGALAVLRRALQRDPGQDAEVFRYVMPYLPSSVDPSTEETAFLTASLFADHPAKGGTGNLGAAFRRLAAAGKAKPTDPIPESVERRFTALLNTETEDLQHHLRHAIKLLRSAEVPVDWRQLLRDLLYWNHPEGFVQRNWAREFWGSSRRENGSTEPADTAE